MYISLLNNKIIPITKKRISAIFLATVLIAGTFALSFPSFMTISAAQAQPYYDDRMDNDYNSYELPEYPSYKPNYKPTYPSYDGKDDKRDKSKKDSIKSNDIKTIKCININLNINGGNAGDVNVGNKGQGASAEEGYIGAYSSDGGYGETNNGYYDGYNNNKKDKDFDCIINNNNNNTNVVGGGNVTDGNGNITDACEECFLDNLSPEQEIALAEELAANFTQFGTIKGLCEHLADETILPLTKADTLNFILLSIGVPVDTRGDIVDCLIELGFDIFRS